MTFSEMDGWVVSGLEKLRHFVLTPVGGLSWKRLQRKLRVWTQRSPFAFFSRVALGVTLLWLISPFYMRWLAGSYGDAGPMGDSFGALTSFFTGAAFLGLIATLMQQQREIRLQRQDLKQQRAEAKRMADELGDQKQQMELQNASIKKQMFEQTFFKLLSLHEDRANKLSLEIRKEVGSSQIVVGPDVLVEFAAVCGRLHGEELKSHRGTGALITYQTRLDCIFVMLLNYEFDDVNVYLPLIECYVQPQEFFAIEMMKAQSIGNSEIYDEFCARFGSPYIPKKWLEYDLDEFRKSCRRYDAQETSTYKDEERP